MSSGYNELTIYARRWHGFARWRLASVLALPGEPIYRFHPIAKGWMRVPRGFDSPMVFKMGYDYDR